MIEEKKVPSNPTSSIDSSPSYVTRNYIPKAHFPSRLASPRKEPKNDEEILEVLKKVEIRLPLLTVIKKIPRYAKFLKELRTNKRKTRDQKKVMVSGNV